MTAHASPLVVSASSETLRQRYLDVRAWTEKLSAPFSPEDQIVQSTPEASPVKWHRAHTSWFFETFILAPRVEGYRPFHPAFRELFNSYYNHVGDRPERTRRGTFSRPSAQEVAGYRAHVDRCMLELLSGDIDAELHALVEIGLNHEQQHQELIVTDVKHAMASNPLQPACGPVPESPAAGLLKMDWMDFGGGIYTIGHNGEGFAFDNEGPQHEVLLAPFALASRLITNGEYTEFIADGGY